MESKVPQNIHKYFCTERPPDRGALGTCLPRLPLSPALKEENVPFSTESERTKLGKPNPATRRKSRPKLETVNK